MPVYAAEHLASIIRTLYQKAHITYMCPINRPFAVGKDSPYMPTSEHVRIVFQNMCPYALYDGRHAIYLVLGGVLVYGDPAKARQALFDQFTVREVKSRRRQRGEQWFDIPMSEIMQSVNPPALLHLENDELGLDDASIDALIMAFLNANRSITTDEATHIVSQARQIRLQNALLDLAIAGKIGVRLDQDQLTWSTPNAVSEPQRR